MKNTRAANRYALAILSVAEEMKQLDAVSQDFDLMDAIIQSSHDFLLFLRSPVINAEKKKVVLNEVFKEKVSQATYLFIHLCTTKGREDILPEIIQQFKKLRDDKLGLLKAEVRIATQMSDEQQQLLIQQLNQRTGKSVRLDIKQDPSVLGGFTVQYEDTVLDGSVRHQLELLAGQFASGIV